MLQNKEATGGDIADFEISGLKRGNGTGMYPTGEFGLVSQKDPAKKLAKLFENARAHSQAYEGAGTTTVNSETDAEAPWHAARSWARRPARGGGGQHRASTPSPQP